MIRRRTEANKTILVSGIIKPDLSGSMRQSAVAIIAASFSGFTGIALTKNAWKSSEHFRSLCSERFETSGGTGSIE